MATNDTQIISSEPEFPLTIEGLTTNKAYLVEQRELGNPDYQYQGNATKTYINRLVDKHIDREWNWVRTHDLPCETEKPVTLEQLVGEVVRLATEDRSWKTRSALIKHFHPSVLDAHRGNLQSPNSGWRMLQEDKEAFRKFYHNRLRCSDWFKEYKKRSEEPTAHWGALLEGSISTSCPFIYKIGLTTSGKFMNVSMFKPHAAKYLVKKYLSEFNEVFDPFSGFSGRLLGTVACGKRYIGRDLSDIVIGESQHMMDGFVVPVLGKLGMNPEFDLKVADCTKEHGTYECLLTCSPYGSTESWKGVATDDRSCDDWIDVCLENYDCRKYVFVTDGNIVKYKEHVKEVFGNQCHWGKNDEYVVVIER